MPPRAVQLATGSSASICLDCAFRSLLYSTRQSQLRNGRGARRLFLSSARSSQAPSAAAARDYEEATTTPIDSEHTSATDEANPSPRARPARAGLRGDSARNTRKGFKISFHGAGQDHLHYFEPRPNQEITQRNSAWQGIRWGDSQDLKTRLSRGEAASQDQAGGDDGTRTAAPERSKLDPRGRAGPLRHRWSTKLGTTSGNHDSPAPRVKPSDHDVQQSGFVSLLPPQAKPTIRMIGSFNRSSEDKQQRTELAGRAETPYHPSRDPDHSRDLNYEPRGQSTFIPSGQEYRESTSERDRLVPRGANHVPRDVSSGDRRISRFVDNSRLDGGRPLLDEGSGSARPRRSRRSYGEEDEESKSNREERTSRKKKKSRSSPLEPVADVAALIPVFLPDFISVVKLAKALKVRPDAFMTKMQELGFEDMTLDHVLNHETAALIAMEYDFDPVVDRSEELDLYPQPLPQDVSILPPRPPIVTIMGHVDHGKTTLLDWLRHSSVVDSEFGGITQHIGAFSVPMPSGKMITFLDTPGHEAFLSMRQRGANVTDIVVLVVAADDSVKPQTVEAIKHAQAAGVPIIVAITKIDKPGANAQQVNLDLVRYGIETEEVGGDTQVVRVSAKAGTGMAELEEAISTLSEVQDHRAPVDGLVEGRLIEAVTTKEGGRVATVLITRGTLKVGDILVAGTTFTRVRKIRSDKGTELEEASPGLPVEIDNWRDQPVAGEMALQAPSESRAREAVSWRTVKAEKLELARDMEAINAARAAETQRREDEKRAAEQAADPKFTTARSTTDTNAAPAPAAEPKLKEAFFIVKGDVSGSVEAVSDSISALGNSEVRANVLRSGVGPPTEFDVEHAAVAQGAIIAFNAVPEPGVSNMAAREGVDILNHRVIYRLVEEVRERLAALLPPKVTVRVTGEAEVATVFDITVKGRKTEPVAGCRVRNGVVSKSAKTRVLRAGEVVFDGKLHSLKHVKKDVAEIRKGSECGLSFEDWKDFRIGDQIQSYEEKQEKRTL